MAKFERIVLQRAISEAYRTSDSLVSRAISKLEDMIDMVEVLDPADSEELYEAAHAVIEEFADGTSTT